MTQEEEQLLLADLCARLPYKIYVLYTNGAGAISTIKGIVGDICYFNENPRYGNSCPISLVKPYLRPMSSMTEEEELDFILKCDSVLRMTEKNHTCILSIDEIDWLLAHHFDYRGLIEKGLALEAPEGMYE